MTATFPLTFHLIDNDEVTFIPCVGMRCNALEFVLPDFADICFRKHWILLFRLDGKQISTCISSEYARYFCVICLTQYLIFAVKAIEVEKIQF